MRAPRDRRRRRRPSYPRSRGLRFLRGASWEESRVAAGHRGFCQPDFDDVEDDHTTSPRRAASPPLIPHVVEPSTTPNRVQIHLFTKIVGASAYEQRLPHCCRPPRDGPSAARTGAPSTAKNRPRGEEPATGIEHPTPQVEPVGETIASAGPRPSRYLRPRIYLPSHPIRLPWPPNPLRARVRLGSSARASTGPPRCSRCSTGRRRPGRSRRHAD